MSDGMGSVNYQYSQLSLMTSEARTFSDPGNSAINGVTKTLSYDYNLGGELKSISDPTGATINYAYDATGRLNAVTGSPFGSVTTYASGAQYRAWGAPKHLAYGNTKTVDATYNPRLQASSFNIPGVLSKTYDYYTDGQLRFSSDLLDHKFDRSYSYDHESRITQAFSGAEARGEGETNARPYKQTFNYDAFSHLIARTSLIWNSGYPALSDSYLNNRRTGWSYDAAGNLLTGADGTYSYDAAGNVNVAGTYDPVSSTTRGLDGEGRQVRTVEVTYHDESSSWVTTTKYYMHSTVLGGQVLTELDSTGAKTRTFVYAGGSVLAWQQFAGAFEEVLWENRDPSNASFRMTDLGGSPWGGTDEAEPAELDPTGANAGIHAPLITDPPPEGAGSLVPYPRFSDPSHPGTSYSVDGMPVPVDYFMQMLDFAFHGSLGLAEASARASRIRLRNYEVNYGEGPNRNFGHDLKGAIEAASGGYTLVRNWIVSDWSFSLVALSPQSYAQKRSDLSPSDKDIRVPQVKEKGTALSPCAMKILGQFFGRYKDVWGRRINDDLKYLRLHSGVPDIVKKYAIVQVDAFTYGTNVFLRDGLSPTSLDTFEGLALQAHEYVHSRQAKLHGAAAIFGILYLGESAGQWLNGGDPYGDNSFEVDAENMEGEFRRWLENKYGVQDPCKLKSPAGGSW